MGGVRVMKRGSGRERVRVDIVWGGPLGAPGPCHPRETLWSIGYYANRVCL